MSKQSRLLVRDARQPLSSSPLVPTHGLELSGYPSRQDQVDVLQGGIESRGTEAPVVVAPATDVRVEHPSQILEGFGAPPVKRPPSDGLTDRLERGWTGSGAERDAHSPVSFAHHPWPEHVAKEGESKIRVIVASALILAVDDFRLLGMQRQSAVSEPLLKRAPQRRRLGFCAAVQIASSA
jgi:hypothetical protein